MDSLMKKEDRGSPDRDRGRERERSRRGDRPSRFSSSTRDRSPVRERRKTGNHTVYVSNVAYESKWQDIKDLFRTEVGEVSHVQLFTDETDKPRGCGVVAFATAELAAKAVEKMHRFDLKGRKLVVKEDSDTERDKFGRPLSGRNRSTSERDIPSNTVMNSRRDDNPRSGTWDGGNSNCQLSSMNVNNSAPVSSSGGSSNASKFGNTYGLSTSFLESLWINGPLVSKVFVANLDYKVDEKKLREVFKLAGKVVHAEINVDKEGKSRGFGVVEYDHPVEAVQAISMLHNQTLFDRRLTVRMDRVEKTDGPPKLPEGLKGIGMGLGTNGSVLYDVARNLPHMTSPQPPSISSVQQLQQVAAAAAAAQAQVQLQGAQLAHLTGSNSIAPNLTNVGVSSLLGSLNVSELTNLNPNQPFSGPTLNTSQTLNPALGASLVGLNASLASGLGVGSSGIGSFNPLNSQAQAVIGGNNNSFNNSSSGMRSPGASFSQSRDFDSMSAALSGQSGYNRDRDNFRSGSGTTPSKVEWSYNGSSRPIGNGRGGSIGNNGGNSMPGSSSIRRPTDTVIVKNLPPNTTWHHLMDTFREVGEILSIDMQGKDAGLVKFSTDWEAERAVRDLDRTRLDGRTIDVLFYYN
ncbi:myelin expression factor 2 isoform X2 [Thrips palmi]|uniref:Myelin expression factor 2 isoform X2 n=1 Tax=Thrips palmi TaxID=161013 RepID=A0A6P8Y239_THRPL|nr:myelin expression factor 2 isoform X2 [Thrips palmi]XP_034230072.1 myelin expression factor 2 isoform X2 [Thrips palmi]XP_034230073.1 myelin expression factor 2 isoform X2 [Thrips palmi]